MSQCSFYEIFQGFYCDTAAAGNGFPGCAIECADDEILVVDPRNAGSWQCRKEADMNGLGVICPGKFHTGSLNLLVDLRLKHNIYHRMCL